MIVSPVTERRAGRFLYLIRGYDIMNKHLFAFLVLTLVFVSCAVAQPLVERVPTDAVLYVGWRGADDLGDGYAGSNLEALRAATELPEALAQTLDVIERANAHNPDVTMVTGLVRTIGEASWRQPTAAYLRLTQNPDMPVCFVVLWQAEGEVGAGLEAQLNQMVARVSQNIPRAPGVPGSWLSVKRADGLVSLTIGEASADGLDAAAVGATLDSNADFKRTVSRVDPQGVLVVYIDTRGLISLVDLAFDAEGNPDDYEMWLRVRSALGLEGLNAAAWSSGFDGKDWRDDLFIDAPAPRVGLMGVFDGDPITDSQLEAVPAEAPWMMAARFDLGALLDTVRKAVNEIAPDASPMMEDALAQANQMTGVNLEADLIRGLGSAWFAYTDPGATGSGMMGMCLVNELNDPEKVRQALVSLQALANAMMGQMGAEAGMRIRFLTSTDQDMTMHSLGVPLLSPTWSIYEGRLYVGLYPQVVMMAGDRIRAGRGSILTNEKFQVVRARLDRDEATAISFADLPATAEGSYPNLVMMSQLAAGFLPMFGGDTMPMLLPPFARIEPYIEPMGQVAWSDDEGYYSRAITPFPGAMMLGPQAGMDMTSSAPVMLGTLLPALGSARQAARGAHSMSNARQLVLGMFIYATDHNDEFPHDIALPLDMGYLDTPGVYLTPASGKQVPPGFDALSKEAKSSWLRQNASYVLIPMPKMSEIRNPSGTICLFELPEDAANFEALVVGFADGHTQAMPIWEAEAVIMEQTGKTMDELAARQRNYQPPTQP